MALTDNELDPIRRELRGLNNKFCCIKEPKVYSSQSEADNDTSLEKGDFYQINGDDTLYLKQ